MVCQAAPAAIGAKGWARLSDGVPHPERKGYLDTFALLLDRMRSGRSDHGRHG